MKNNHLDPMIPALERMELYCLAHPGTPTAVRRPQLFFKSGTWIALLGRDMESGIVGVGSSVDIALRAFDAHYLAALRPPAIREAA